MVKTRRQLRQRIEELEGERDDLRSACSLARARLHAVRLIVDEDPHGGSAEAVLEDAHNRHLRAVG